MKRSSDINAQTVLNAVTGYPLGHTMSPQIHEIIYRELGLNAVMLAFPQEEIKPMLAVMRTLPIRLLAVTLPHKQEVMKHLDNIDADARKIGAVNTVINREGKLYGYNTDVVGIREALKSVRLKNRNTLVLGAGGATRAVCWFLKNQGAKIFCHNRTHQKAAALMKEFAGKAVTEKELQEGRFDVIINATPVGMAPHVKASPFPKNLLKSHQTVFDLIYNPLETQLIKDAKKADAKTVSGMTMLVAQALEQVWLWSGKKTTESQKKALLRTIGTI